MDVREDGGFREEGLEEILHFSLRVSLQKNVDMYEAVLLLTVNHWILYQYFPYWLRAGDG